ncbi:MAG: hypothetical protein ACOVN1_02850 [Limnohabitans sp.]|jgi:hypothetical protein
MSTENTIQPTANSAAVKVADKSATTTTQTAQTPAKKTVRKAAKKAPRKSTVKAPVKAKSVATKKPASRPANQTASAPTKKAAAQPKVKAATKVQPAAETKLKKPKLIRDSFTFPKDEYQAIAGLKQKALGLKHSAKKSEILRAGLKLLNSLNDKAFLAALTNVPALKTGRPAKS